MKTKYLDLHRMDCMELMAQYPDKHFDLAIVDPPYGIKRFNRINEGDAIHSKSDDGKNWNNEKPKQEYWNELFRVSLNQIVWGANNFTLPESEYFCVWDKKQMYPNFARCELAYVSMGLKKPAKMFEFGVAKIAGKKEHPAMKPIELYRWLLETYAEPGQKILDTHMGSGSIAIACHYAQCHLTASELDEDYFNAACERIERETRQQTLF